MPWLRNKRLWIAGHCGLVGQASVRQAAALGATVLSADRAALDLRDQSAVRDWVLHNRPDAILIAAATVGGIEANRTRPAEFLYDNLMIAANIIHAAAQARTSRLLFLGSSCIYPRDAAQPVAESALMTGPLEPTNDAYAIAKIAGIRLCQAMRQQYGHRFIAAMPCNLYGPGDRFDERGSHVIPALILKMERARMLGQTSVSVWGTGTPLREFLHADDLAAALMILLEDYDSTVPVNIGSGDEISIADLARSVAAATGYRGEIVFDPSMPNGAPRKVLDSSIMRAMGWAPRVAFDTGLRDTVAWYRAHAAALYNDAA